MVGYIYIRGGMVNFELSYLPGAGLFRSFRYKFPVGISYVAEEILKLQMFCISHYLLVFCVRDRLQILLLILCEFN